MATKFQFKNNIIELKTHVESTNSLH